MTELQSKSATAQIVDLRDRLVALRYAGNGDVAALFETPASGVHLARETVEVVIGRGFAGDHPEKSFYRGAYVPGREVSACASEVLAAMNVDPAVVGDNLVTRGIDLCALESGQTLEIGEVVLQRSDREHRPCATFRERTSPEAFDAAALGYRGALFVVVRGGRINVGDSIRVLD
ncbi:MAG TPA: MOSC domain-containing protein [Rhodothermales bacterium]